MPRKYDPQEAGYGLKYVLTTHLFTLLGANFICFVFCIPILTIPASLCGLNAVVQQYYRKGYGDMWETFIEEFKTDFFPRLGISAALLLPPGIGWLLGSLAGGLWPWLGLALLLLFSILVFAWLYPQLALLKLPPLTALKNAAILTIIEPGRDLLLLLITLLCFLPMVLLLPFSGFLLFCVYPLFPVLLRTAVTDKILTERLVQEDGSVTPEDAG